MRWVTYRADGGERTGVLSGEEIHAMPPGVKLLDLIERGADALRVAGEQALRGPATVRLDEVTLAAPIPRPPSIRDCLCFLDHMRNCQQAAGGGRVLKDVWYRIPAFYFACPTTVLGPYDDAPMAPGTAWQDFELEIGAVIGTTGKDLSVEQAEDAIIGYLIFNDWSARDLQRLEGQLGIGQAKGKDSGVTLGPYLVTSDELEPYRRNGKLSLEVTASVNDTVIGSGSTGTMDWTFGEVISYASRGVTLVPGDVFGSGTVPTCTLVEHLTDREAFPGWLHDGDVVTLRVQGLGETRQTVRATRSPQRLAARPNPDIKPDTPRVNRAPAKVPYTRGLHQVADRVWAWTLPDGGYGWSNAGLVAGDGASLLVDTLFDLPLTREMLTAMRTVTDHAPITDALITHSNGDHTHGNQLLDASVRIIAAKGTAEEIAHGVAPEMLAMIQTADFGPVATRYARDRFGPFDFSGIRLRNADQTFDDELTIDVGGRPVRLLNLGPAHTAADSVVHVPDAGVLFAGDLLFIGCTPIVWTGPIANWIAACDSMLALDAPTVVPGHGPVTDPDGIRAVRGYFVHIAEAAEAAYRKGLSFVEAADTIDLGEYATWLDAERVVANVYRRYRELDPDTPQLELTALLVLQAEWLAKRG
ncbi:2-hydroxyhepta-2,4-diene-1,7-dioate isomerase [Mycobacterium heckeshornense]|uniref:Bifunctional 2-hydroxyhepta-2,4-diene-1,7-dioate isomerase/cyclase/dehydrase n=1 Tax=Mycobacterium heckeshornense TaxID=110505 RepID=A0A2G8B9M6_9MYCO|nr:fumarylacetoacetate hydrolase family protein [Mycobacterium heckeshornense]KMV23863.1 2-hydroxyhepta-2,4-diene-1,7-dioate isomerase [Mycobacterium heckeshornense]MCV7033387.1 fumarylacetoacetate hydrolase family protein [Mycobacterium heckeshornense]PIJ34465.1 2-hydroxyhepta-2,4-diene-1,7-dioate isomerase [Mycobacterium heckeshornense]BCO34592.1 bifunctional 2-hydroxyhepta-2,4-diene-1,7-dioate isomerase/cyclase/dehydrase [Mycobacterium heckeshornense]